MSEFKIKCETFLRLATVCEFFEPTIAEDVKEKLNTVLLENKNGVTIAVATNSKVAAIEFLDNTDAEDEITFIKLTEELLKQCEIESVYDSTLTITTIPEIAVSSLQSTLGFSATECCYWFDNNEIEKWRDWAAPNAEESEGIMFWNLYQLESLMKSSPSGKIIFPEHINAKQPVTVRDYKSPNWVGLFFPKPSDMIVTKEATLPDWWNK